jgi:uncharacterized protein YkwD
MKMIKTVFHSIFSSAFRAAKSEKAAHRGCSRQLPVLTSSLLGLMLLFAVGCSFSNIITVELGEVKDSNDGSRLPAQTPLSATPTLRPRETLLPLTGRDEISDLEGSAHGDTSPPDFEDLEQDMLLLINEDRQANGLNPVEWDILAAAVARAHTQEMVNFNYLSHWNTMGLGPDVRYGLAGGVEVVQENVYAYVKRSDDGSPLPITNWEQILSDAERRLMESPGHRENILNPAHTHVGVGMAYDPQTGEFRLAQEFLNRYASFTTPQELPLIARPGEQISFSWRLLPPASAPLINLTYQPFPEPMKPAGLDRTDTYTSPAEIIQAKLPSLTEEGSWTAAVKLPEDGQPGYYHIMLWVELDGLLVPAGDLLVEMRG